MGNPRTVNSRFEMDRRVISRVSEHPCLSDVFCFDGPVVDPVVDEFVLGVGGIMRDLYLVCNFIVGKPIFADPHWKLDDGYPAEIGSEVDQMRDS